MYKNRACSFKNSSFIGWFDFVFFAIYSSRFKIPVQNYHLKLPKADSLKEKS